MRINYYNNSKVSKRVKLNPVAIWMFLIIAPIVVMYYSIPPVHAEIPQVKSEVTIKPIENQGVVADKMVAKDIPAMIREKFGKDGEKAIAIARCESNLTPDRIGDNYPIKGKTIPSIGIFQIRAFSGRPSIDQLKNPQVNIDYAYDLYKRHGGFARDWVWCDKNGK